MVEECVIVTRTTWMPEGVELEVMSLWGGGEIFGRKRTCGHADSGDEVRKVD